jgi:methylated-DNA-[protein]-cysteine S-methyltransferase
MEQTNEFPGSVVYHHSYISPVGPLYLAVTREGLVLRISYSPLHSELFPGLRLEENKYACGEVAYQLEEYFLGKRQRFDLSLHLDQGTNFQKDVWNRLLKIPFGSTMTYGEVAQKVGRRDASRAVGNAVGKNPLPILVPCHRVVPKAGGLGGYTARTAPSEDPDHGTKIKGYLLEIESALQKH